MFGGLEVKGGEKKDDKKDSGFSFLNSGAPAQPVSNTLPAESGFSFIMSSTNPPKPVEVVAPVSGFSFMSSAHVAAPEPAPSSGFDFMMATPPTADPLVEQPPPSSGFGFISSTVADGPPAGAGVTFGGATVTSGIKRRTRAPKPGVGVATYSVPPMLPTPTVPAPIQHSTSYGSLNTKDQAEEAIRRAEEFMQSKLQEQSRLGSVSVEETATVAGLMSPTSKVNGEVDDELQEAMRAAEAAQARLAREGAISRESTPAQTKSAFSWFGSGFGGKANKESSGSFPMSGGPDRSSHSSKEMGIPSPHTSEHGDATQAERILREQEAIKKAMAERHLKMQLEEQPTGTIWDRPVEVDMSPSWTKQTPGSSLAKTSSVPSWGVKALAPPAPSPREVMDIMLQQFAGDVRRAMDKVGQLRQQRNMLLEERFVALAKERLAVQQIVQTETQQLDAAEKEDFELADRLQVVLDGHNREKAECTAIIDNISKALLQLDEQTPSVVDAVANCFADVERELRDFQAKQKAIVIPNDAMERFGATSKQLSSEDERLKSEAKHLERDEELVQMERKELDDAIAEQTTELEAIRAASKAELDLAEQEMEELRAKLRLKEAECNELRIKINAQDTDISKILVKFNRQILRVQKKERSVAENRKEWENEHNTFIQLKEAHDAQVKAHSDELLERNDLMEALKTEVSMAFKLRDIIANEVNFDHTREENEEADGDLAQLQADVVKCEAAVAEAQQIVKVAEATLVTLDHESRRLQEKIPKFEAEKTAAAAKRDFKTAGKASKEIKEATARLKDLEENLIDEAKEKRKEALMQLERVTKELDEEKAIANEKEKVAGKIAMEKIAERIKTLLVTKKEVCGRASPDTVQGVGALVLKRQIDALKQEGQSLGEKFGGWEEFITEIDEENEVPADFATNGTERSASAAEVSKEKRTSSRPSDEVVPEKVEMAKGLMKKLSEIEAEVVNAADEEDYDKAAELDELLQEIKNEVEGLDLTDAENDLVMAEEISGEEMSSGEEGQDSLSEDETEEDIEHETDDDDQNDGDEDVENEERNDTEEDNGVNTEEDEECPIENGVASKDTDEGHEATENGESVEES